MEYSQFFIAQVKEKLPHAAEIHEAVDAGSPETGNLIECELKSCSDLFTQWTKEVSNSLKLKT